MNAFLEINSGAGGVEANDWASMLLRMYLRWAERHGVQADLVDSVGGDVVGIKSATVWLNGENVSALLQSEHCVHRLVRLSPFNVNNKRQTSFARVTVTPDIGNEKKVEIAERDLRVDDFKVSHDRSAVRITHLPTNIIATCQSELFAYQNRDLAMRLLQSKVFAVGNLRGRNEIGFGHQTRNYVFQPYTLVKDTRTNCETDDITRVMNGDIDDFIDAYLHWQQTQDDENI